MLTKNIFSLVVVSQLIGAAAFALGAPDSNALVFNKNPVYVAQQAIGYNSESDGLLDFKYYREKGKITDTVNGVLKNADIDVLMEEGQTLRRARANNLSVWKWVFPVVNDPYYRFSQANSYFWLDYQKKVAEGHLAKSWHAAKKDIKVYTRCNRFDFGVNAFWIGASEGNYICLGYGGPIEVAFDASVTVHEMGHANVDYATNAQIYANDNSVECGQNYCCKSADGCSFAINEGQADYNSYMVFNSGRVGEWLVNDIHGLEGRDAEFNRNLTSSQMFNGTAIDPRTNSPYGEFGKEVHLMGGVWGAALWTLRLKIGAEEATRIFLASLELLQGNDTFRTGINTLITADRTLSRAKKIKRSYKTEILASFSQHGIQPK